MGKGAVGLGHLVNVVALADRGTLVVGGFLDFVGKSLVHRHALAVAGVVHNPAHGQRFGTGRVHFQRHLVGGATYQVPLEVDPARSESLAMRWIVNYARNRKGVPMHKALANEIKEAANNQGSSVRKRDDVHKMAQANRAFAHFRW